MNFYLGCAVWSYKGWVGDFYPSGSRAADFLHLYSRRLPTVEGNTTFYAVPEPNKIARWAAQTPPGFKFCLKLPREITHGSLLTPALYQALSFLELAQGLGERLGPIFAQLPPSYSPNNLEDLATFLAAIADYQLPFALEVRHPDWFKAPHNHQLADLLQALGIGKVLLDSRPIYQPQAEGEDSNMHKQITQERRKPNLPLQPVVTAPFSLIRFISHPQAQLNQVYWQEWVKLIQVWLREGKQIYFFVHCPQEEQSPHNARYFQQLLIQQGVAVPPLPWEQLQSSPVQLDLFTEG